MLLDTVVVLTIFEARLDDGFFLGDLGMPGDVLIDVAAAQYVHIVEETSILLSQDSRNVCLTIAAYLNDFFQTEVGVQIEPLPHQCLFYAVGDLLTGLFGNIPLSLLGPLLCHFGMFFGSSIYRGVRLLYGGRIVWLRGGSF